MGSVCNDELSIPTVTLWPSFLSRMANETNTEKCDEIKVVRMSPDVI